MMRHRDLWAAAGGALICAAVAVLVPVTAVRAIFAIPLCLVLPGYVIVAATFAHGQLTTLQTTLLTLALSLCTLILGSLLLDAVPGGIRIGSWTALLLVVVLAGCAVATRRRDPRAASVRAPRRKLRLRSTEMILLVFALLTAGSALALSRVPVGARYANGYTQMWMLQAGSAAVPTVQIGVRSEEKQVTTYRVVVTTGAHAPKVVEPSLTLEPGGSRVLYVPLSNLSGQQTVVTAKLYKAGDAAVYRHVTALVSPPVVAPVVPGSSKPARSHHR
jgi:hypothetical protein